MKKLLGLIAAVVLTACVSMTQERPDQTVYALKANYISALTAADAYKKLPSCEQPAAPVLCSKVSVVKQLRVADNAAFDALTAAEQLVRASGPVEKIKAAIEAASQLTNSFSNLVLEVRR